MPTRLTPEHQKLANRKSRWIKKAGRVQSMTKTWHKDFKSEEWKDLDDEDRRATLTRAFVIAGRARDLLPGGIRLLDACVAGGYGFKTGAPLMEIKMTLKVLVQIIESLRKVNEKAWGLDLTEDWPEATLPPLQSIEEARSVARVKEKLGA